MNNFNVKKVVFGLMSAGLMVASFSSQATTLDQVSVPAEFTVSGSSSLAVTWTGRNVVAGNLADATDLGTLNIKVLNGDALSGDTQVFISSDSIGSGSGGQLPVFKHETKDTNKLVRMAAVSGNISLDTSSGIYNYKKMLNQADFEDMTISVQSVGEDPVFEAGKYVTNLTVTLMTV